MKMFSYHTKMRLRKVLQVLGILALAALAVWVCWMVWLQRYVVFTRDGVIFDFGRSSLDLGEKETRPGEPEQTLDVQVEFREAPPEAQSLSRLSGVYVDTDRLQAGVETASQALGSLEPGTAVMLDVKSKFGNFYYTTGLSGASQSDTMEAAAMDALLADLIRQDCYLIARLPAFRDSAFAEANPDSGLALDSGALWTDEEQCYWLDPASQTVMANLIQICRELRELGFDEVVFTDFRIPDSGSIVYKASASKEEILKQAAQQLVTSCADPNFVVSFFGPADFPLPAGQTRLYLEGVDPAQADSTAQKVSGSDPATQVVFLTASRDTRFDAYGVLRPLDG